MTRLALRGLAARKLRTSLTVIAVLLAVTMIAGTFVLTDTIQKAFDDIFTSQTKGASVVVSGKSAVDSDFAMPRPLDAPVAVTAARERQRQPDVLLRRQDRHEVEGLEDEADLVAAQASQLTVAHPVIALAAEGDLT